MSTRFLIVVVFISLFSAACNQGNMILDNAGDEILRVRIGDQTAVVSPREFTDIQIDAGTHTLRVENASGDALIDTTLQVGEGGLLNLAGGRYILWREVFASRSTLPIRDSLLDTRELKIDRQRYEVDYDTLEADDLYTERRWDLGLDETFPEKVYGWQLESGEKYLYRTRLIRREDFPAAYLKGGR